MQKRARSDSLTGGTNDVNPQYLSGQVVLSAANTPTEVVMGTPIVRVGTANPEHAIIMEVLKVFVDMPAVDQDNASVFSRYFQISFCTSSFGASVQNIANPRCFAAVAQVHRNAFSAGGTGLLDFSRDPYVWDCTDGAGHGILIATDNIFIQASTAQQSLAATFPFKILYRFKKVSLVEYIGIVQSQQ